MTITGRWRIVAMELWDQDAIDLVRPGFIEIRNDDQGTFRLIAVEGWMDIRAVGRDGRDGLEFSWDGSEEHDPACGRGWATLSPGGSLEGRIFLHMGDDAWFRAEPGPVCPYS